MLTLIPQFVPVVFHMRPLKCSLFRTFPFFFVFSLILISAFFLVFSFFYNQIRCTFPSVDGVHVLYHILVYCTGNFKAAEKLLSNLLFSQ